MAAATGRHPPSAANPVSTAKQRLVSSNNSKRCPWMRKGRPTADLWLLFVL
jgi:hypothetical protein